MKFDKFTDICITGVYVIPPVIETSVNFYFSTYIFSADITPDKLKLCRVTKVKVLFLVLVYVFNFNLFEISAAILEKGPLTVCGHAFAWLLLTISTNIFPENNLSKLGNLSGCTNLLPG